MNERTNNPFEWTNFYMEFADKLLQYKNKRDELISIIQNVYGSVGMKYPFMDNGVSLDDICPFTVFGCFNKGITEQNRISIMTVLGGKLGVKSAVPTKFDGIPVLNNMKAWFFGYKSDRKPDDISNLWDVFEAALIFADNPNDDVKATFIRYYDKVRKQIGVKWNITMGLYWIRPYAYLNLDERNRKFLLQDSFPLHNELISTSNLKQLPTGKEFTGLIEICKLNFAKEHIDFHNFPELSYKAWLATYPEEQNKRKSTASFLKWFSPIVKALKELGGSGTPEDVRKQIISNLRLSDEVIN